VEEVVKAIKELGLPGWVLTVAGILLILNQLKILDPIVVGVKSFFESQEKKAERRELHRIEMEKSKAKNEGMEELRSQYSSSWLMEQVTQNSADALAQLGSYQEYVQREVSKKLDIVVELGMRLTKIEKDTEEIRVSLRELYTQLDVLDRHIYEIKQSDSK